MHAPLEAGILGSPVTAIDGSRRLGKLRALAAIAVALLFFKILLSILVEYRWYFPADFENSAFLSGRRYSFFGIYRAAFYAHIISGPLAVLLGSFLILTGGRSRYRHLHRPAGKLQMLIVLIVVPSGLVMARQAYGGSIAALGFSSLSIATGACAMAAVYCAVTRRFRIHQRWATRCFILLTSPLLLRLINGAVVAMQLESDFSYRLNAWLSWLIPLAIYEVWWRCRASGELGLNVQSVHRAVEVGGSP
jgi:hypothetical protein